jgi:hypothetical protein
MTCSVLCQVECSCDASVEIVRRGVEIWEAPNASHISMPTGRAVCCEA